MGNIFHYSSVTLLNVGLCQCSVSYVFYKVCLSENLSIFLSCQSNRHENVYHAILYSFECLSNLYLNSLCNLYLLPFFLFQSSWSSSILYKNFKKITSFGFTEFFVCSFFFLHLFFSYFLYSICFLR